MRLTTWLREAWDGRASAYRELQESAVQDARQREYVSMLIRTAPEARKRIEARWAEAMPAWKRRARCVERWRAVYREHCLARWATCQAEKPRLAPIPMRREAAR